VSVVLLQAAVWTGTVALAVTVAPPVDGVLSGRGAATAIGAAAGAAVFLALGRARVSLGVVARVGRRRALARSVLLTGRSAYEEALWRGLLLGWLASTVGRLTALAAATTLFAASHVPSQGRRAAAHVVTGAAFGGAYLLTGALLAAIVAHALYNVLVGLVRLDATTVPFGQSTAREDRHTIGGALPRGTATTPPRPLPDGRAPLARLEDVRRTFGSVVALDGLTLELGPGEVLALLGPNGAGKSTAVAIMLGLRRPDSGKAVLFGRDPSSPDARREIGVVLQEATFPWTLRVREVVELVRRHYERPRATDELIDLLGLAPNAGRQTGGLSGGQKRRLALALAFAGQPRALFLDEPTAGLDVDARRALWSILGTYVEAGGAILLTTHRIEEVEAVASRVVLMAAGRVIREGTVDDVRREAGLTRVQLRAARLPALPAVVTAESRFDRHTIYTDRSDEVVSALVASGEPFAELEVAPARLEDAFLVLTGGER
jgi:ABC-2 type transport system ATP-binding protein